MALNRSLIGNQSGEEESGSHSVAALRYLAVYPRWLLALGALTAVVDVVYAVFNSVRLLEWVTTALFLCYVCSLAIEAVHLGGREQLLLASHA